MATQFQIDCALMAGRAYQQARAAINWFPVPSGWTEFFHVPNPSFPTTGGFEAVSFQSGSQIVISFTGTDQLSDWTSANVPLAFGLPSTQLYQAAQYYLDVKAANPPGTVISFTGHSLGGGLAALMGVLFDEQAVTFDQAPFANAAKIAIRDDLVSYLTNHGYTIATLSAMAPELFSYDGSSARTANVSSFYVQGEAMQYQPFSTIGSQTMLDQTSTGLGLSGPVSLHSIALLNAFLENKDFEDVTAKLPDLLAMLFDGKLFAHPTDDPDNRNFLENLVRHEAGVGATVTGAAIPADAMLTRFTDDLQKLAQPGGLTLHDGNPGNPDVHDLSDALIAFAMQFYYENTPNAINPAKELFSTDGLTGGIRFDIADVADTLAAAKGYSYFKNYLKQGEVILNGEVFTPGIFSTAEQHLIQSLLPALRDWYVQAGTGGMMATDTQNLGDFMLGGSGSDTLTGGTKADLLVGNAGDDHLQGGKNNDTLIGGAGNDTYIISAGDGYDTVLDSDGSGVIEFGTVEAKGDAGLTDATKWIQLGTDTWADTQNGITYTRSVVDGETQLLIHQGDSNVLVKGWVDGELGIVLGAGAPPVPPATTLTGTAAANYLEAASGGQRVEGLAGADMIHGSAGIDHLLGGDGGDWIVGNGGADHIEGGLGNDYISGIGANSLAEGGDGNDILSAYGTDWITIQGPNSPISADVFWADAASVLFNPGSSVYTDSNGDPTFEYGGFPVNASSSGASSLGGGWTYQFTVANGTWDAKYFHPQTAPDGIKPAAYWEQRMQGQTLTESVFLQGGAGDDLLIGNNGNDVLDGGTGQDNLFGIDGDDVLDGGAEADILAGGNGADVLIGGAGTDTLFGEAGDDILLGGSEDDALVGGAGNDVLDGGAGADTLQAGAGNDTYLNVTGQDSLFDIEGDNLIQLATATGIGAGGLTTSATPTNGLSVDIALDSGDTLKLDSAFYGMSATITFANGDAVDLETLVGTTLATPLNLQNDDNGGKVYGGAGNDGLKGGAGNDTLSGHDGNDTLLGGAGDDVLDGGAGNDLLSGGQGNDTYVVSGGRDTLIDEQSGTAQQGAALRLNAQPNDLAVALQTEVNGSQTLSLTQADGSGVDVRNGFLGVVGSITLGDGSTQSLHDLVNTYATQNFSLNGTPIDDSVYGGAGNDVMAGLTGDDVLYGGKGDDTLDGGEGADTLRGEAGNDTLYGGAGVDTYTFGIGDGNDVVIAPVQTDLNADVLQMGQGINAGDLAYSRLADGSLLLRINGTQDSVKFEGWFDNGPGISTVRFADGTEVDAAAISARAVEGYGGTELDDHLTGTASNDHILGYGGNDVLSGGAGDDVLEGGAGADTYLFGWSSSGNDVLVDTSLETSTIVLTEGAGLSDLKHSRVGDSLLISLRGNAASLTLKDYFTTAQPWSMRDGNGVEVSIADWLSQPAAKVSIDSVRDDFLGEVRVQFSEEQIAQGYERLDQDTFEHRSAYLYGSDQDIQHLSVLTYSSDDALIYRQSVGVNFTSSSVEITQVPTSESVAGGQVFIPLTTLLESGAGSISTNGLTPVYGPAQGSPFDAGGGQTLVGFITQTGSSTQQNVVTHYYKTTATTDTIVEQINGGDSDNVISGNVLLPNIYSPGDFFPFSPGRTATLIDGGGGNDTIYAPGLFGVPDVAVSSIGGLSSFLYGNAGDDKLYGSGEQDTLAGGSGSDYLDGSVGADTYVVFAGDAGTDVVWDSGAPLGRTGPGGHVLFADYADLQAAYYAYLGIDPNATGVTLPPLPVANDYSVLTDLTSLGAIPMDTVKLMGGIHPGDLAFSWGQIVHESARDLPGHWNSLYYSQTMHAVLNLSWATGESLSMVIPNSTDLIGTGIERFVFDDGTVLSMSEMLALAGPAPTLNPQDEDNLIHGGAASDAIDGEGGNDLLYGGSGDDRLTGGAGNDTLDGGDGDDALDGGVGTDTLIGSTGNDSYMFGIGYGQDTVQDVDTTSGNIDTVWMTGIASADVSISRTATQLVLSLNANDALRIDWNPAIGSGVEQVAFDDGTVRDAATLLESANHAPTVAASIELQTATENTAFSFVLPDTVFSDADAGVWDALTYTATLVNGHALPGWLAFDAATRVFSGTPADGDVGTLALRVMATDTLGAAVFTDFNLSVANANIAPVVASQIANQSVNEGSVLSFAIPATTFTDANVGDVLNYSVALADGNALPAWLTYNAATRTLAGTPADSAAGDYTVRVTATDTAGATAHEDFILSVADTQATIKNGTSGAETLNGTRYKDMLNGLGGNDVLYGYAGDDTLDGGTGNDTMAGGAGDDVYIVDSTTDVITENADEGIDSVQSSVKYTLAADVENLTLTGTAAINGTGNALDNFLAGNSAVNTLTGGAGNDRLDGGSGADKMLGGTGDDTYVVDVASDVITEKANEGVDTVESSVSLKLAANVENLILTGTAAINGTGNTLNNVLAGNSADNTLSGGTGADTMIGGAGNDTYVIDNTLDVVTENLNEGTDLVQSSVTYTLAANVESLTLTGTAAINGSGNALDNVLVGNSAANILTGGAGSDRLDGKAGADKMLGGVGDDTYVVNVSTDVVIENANEGIDSVESSVTLTLSANVENLTLTGTSAINGTGNALDNVLKGNGGANKLIGDAGNDTLDGGAGADTLTGGTGNDTYVMALGYGADTLVENDATAGNTDIAQFLSGVAADQIWFQHVSNNLEVSIIGTTDKLVIKDWYTGTADHVEQFKTTDGAKTLLDSNVQNLVNAMASFAPPAAGQTTLPANYQTSLAPVIAANWQ